MAPPSTVVASTAAAVANGRGAGAATTSSISAAPALHQPSAAMTDVILNSIGRPAGAIRRGARHPTHPASWSWMASCLVGRMLMVLLDPEGLDIEREGSTTWHALQGVEGVLQASRRQTLPRASQQR